MDDEQGREASSKKQAASQLVKDKNLVDVIFSWSVDDILNGDLYKDQVGKIPDAFESIENYLSSFVYPLLEETRSDICSKIESISTAPFGKVISVERPKQQSRKLFYDLMVEDWKYNSYNSEKDPYRAKPGDVIAFTAATPGQYLDVERLRMRCNLGYVTNVLRDDCMYAHFEVRTSKELELGKDGWNKSLYAVFVANVTTSNRIWKALRFNQNLDVIKETLGTNSMVQGCCMLCPSEMKKKLEDRLCLPSYLNKSQRQAILECVFKSHCAHKSSLELIWGPPGTGKTRTLAVMLWSLLQLKCRTLICCPTNVAISEIASRVMKLVNEDDTSLYSLGDILLYGNIDQTAYVIEEMCLDYRVKKLSECLGDGTGWRHCIITMIELLEDCVSKYKNFCDSKIVKDDHKYVNDGESFLNFIRDNFIATASSVRNCISTIFTHLPKKFIREHNYKDMVALMTMLDSFESFLFQTNVVGEELKEAFVCEEEFESLTHVNANVSRFLNAKGECVRFLRNLLSALDGLDLPKCDKDSIEEFCYKMASLIFCTASSSYKLQSVKMYPIKLLVIDEASQLKECELLVPLQVPSIKHVVLLGDECQLPAFVSSKVSAEAGIGRSLFERLSTLGFTRHLLDTQYRMHPNISKFPNAKFYQNRIMDAEIVKSDIYEKCYIPDPMFGSYSFMNISCGRESHTDTHSLTNMVEVAVLLKIIHRVYKACEAAKVKVTVGVVSPYSAQVSEIQRRLGKKYDDNDSFKVHIRTIDGFQGGEDDIVIISTVRSNQRGSLGFTSSPRRINVALTRARHCLWILGNEETLSKSDSVWEQLVLDAKVRQCFFNADDDKGLQAVIMEVKKELDQLGDMLKEDSMFFRNARWKVCIMKYL
ncbi:helicase sen1-like [Daucus carota subsp. sativus]|uniref:helicase sen1-like n=1 Tax=Daucus carota subsp. sativus TaxID=79200 RepID=UPI003083BD6C